SPTAGATGASSSSRCTRRRAARASSARSPRGSSPSRPASAGRSSASARRSPTSPRSPPTGAPASRQAPPSSPWAGCPNDLEHRVDHVADVGVAHAAVDRQRDLALVLAPGDRKVLGAVAVGLAVIRMRVEWDEVDARADAPPLQLLDDRGAVEAQAIGVDAQRVEGAGGLVALGARRGLELPAGAGSLRV